MSKPIKVLHFSSRYEECGIAKYLNHYVQGMKDEQSIQNDYFPTSPYETHNMNPDDLAKMSQNLEKALKGYDVLHVQHEFALYAHDSFLRIVEAGKRAGKKVIITVHISPSMHGASKKPHLGGLGPHSIMHFLREQRHHNQFVRINMAPFRMADMLLVHNDATAASLRSFGIPESRIKKTIHPVQVYSTPPVSKKITTALQKQKGDIIYCTTGFIHRYKGIVAAISALKFLPDNYKLAILGGMKADSDDVAYYDTICDLINTLGVRNRVYIAGYVPTDDQLNAFIRECDICVYPYDRVYYASVSSGSLNLAFANGRPVVAYPTESIKELAAGADGAISLCETFAYYELARALQNTDRKKQAELSVAYAKKAAWPKLTANLVEIYKELVRG